MGASDAPETLSAVSHTGRSYSYREIGGVLVRSLQVMTAEGPVQATAGNGHEAMRAFAAFASRQAQGASTVWPFLERRVVTARVWKTEDWHEIKETDRAAALAEYRAAWAGAACVDGVIHVKSAGPAWFLAAQYRVRGAVWEGTSDVPAEAEMRPMLKLVGERGHLARPGSRWTFPPGILDLARVRVDEALAARALPGNPRVRFWRGPQAEPSGSVSGIGLPPPPPPSSLRATELAAAVRAMLGYVRWTLDALPPAAIHLFTDLKEMHEAGIGPAEAPAALTALRGFHSLWKELPQSAGKAGSDGVAALLDNLGAETPAEGGPWPAEIRAQGR